MVLPGRQPRSAPHIYYPGTTRVPERSAANVHGVSYKALAEVEFTSDSEGVIFASGSRFGGHALFVKDGRLVYSYSFLGIPPETQIVAAAPSSGRHIVGVDYTKERPGERHESYGPLKLHGRRGRRRRAGDPHDDRPLLALRRGALHRLRQRRLGVVDVHAELRVERRADREGRVRRRR